MRAPWGRSLLKGTWMNRQHQHAFAPIDAVRQDILKTTEHLDLTNRITYLYITIILFQDWDQMCAGKVPPDSQHLSPDMPLHPSGHSTLCCQATRSWEGGHQGCFCRPRWGKQVRDGKDWRATLLVILPEVCGGMARGRQKVFTWHFPVPGSHWQSGSQSFPGAGLSGVVSQWQSGSQFPRGQSARMSPPVSRFCASMLQELNDCSSEKCQFDGQFLFVF